MKRPLRRRAGILLVEVIIAMMMGIVLVATATAMFVQIVETNPAAREHLHTTMALGRLSRQFRADVHAVTAAAENAEGTKLTLSTVDGARIEYELIVDGVRRTTFNPDQPAGHEQFTLGEIRPAGWKLDEATKEVSLLVERIDRQLGDDPDEPAVRYQLPITAHWGRDARFAGAQSRGQETPEP